MMLKYSDVYLEPRYSVLYSRADANTSIQLGKHSFQLPIIPANMPPVIDRTIAEYLSRNGYFYIYHRFEDTLDFVNRANEAGWPVVSISVGIKERDRQLIRDLEHAAVDFVTIDVAHGHHKLVKKMIDHVKHVLPATTLIAGNVATADAVQDLAHWGADAVKVGIGGGAACTTSNKTGFHIPMFSCVLSCAKGSSVPIIADGGIRENGDIAKALVAGAHWVMTGNMFVACSDSPAETINDGDGFCKCYYGSASQYNKSHKRHLEGRQVLIPMNGMTYREKLEEIQQDLSSSVSYAGGKDLSCLKSVRYLT